MHGCSRSGRRRRARSTTRSCGRCSICRSSCCYRRTAIRCATTRTARSTAQSAEKLLDGLAAFVAVVARQLVDVHVDELRRVVVAEVAREGERVPRRLLAVLEPGVDRVEQHVRQLVPARHVAAYDVDAERKRQARLEQPPLAAGERL